MSLREKIENNIVIFTLGYLLTGFIAGVSVLTFLRNDHSISPISLFSSHKIITCNGLGAEIDLSKEQLSGFGHKSKFLNFSLEKIEFDIVNNTKIIGEGTVISIHPSSKDSPITGKIHLKGTLSKDEFAYMEYELTEDSTATSWNGVIVIRFHKNEPIIGYWLKEDLSKKGNFSFGDMSCNKI